MKFLSPKTDIAFKKLFGDKKGASRTINFLNSILELQEGSLITEIVIDNTENLPLLKGRKKSFIDVRCTDQASKKYIIEMQKVDEHDFLQRAGFYSSIHIHSQLKKKEPYTKIMPVIFVGVLDFELFSTFKHSLSHHFFTESQTHERTLMHSEFHFVELPKFSKKIDQLQNDLERWLYLFKHAEEMREVPKQLKNSEELFDAMQLLNQSCWTEKEYMEYLAELDVERGKISTEQWMEAELVKRSVAGKAEGEREKAIAIAKSMLAAGMSLDQVVKFTGLTVDEIKSFEA